MRKINRILDISEIFILNIIVLLTMAMNFDQFLYVKSIKNIFIILSMILFVIKFLFYLIFNNDSLAKIKKTIFVILLFMLSVNFSNFINDTVTFESLYNINYCFLIFLYFASLYSSKDITRVILIEKYLSIFFLIVYLVLFFSNNVYTSGQRTTMGLVLPFLLISLDKEKFTIYTLILPVLFIVASILSMNRTYLIVGIVYMVVLVYKKNNKLLLPFILLILVLFVYRTYSLILAKYGIDILGKSLNGDITSGRLTMYKNLLENLSTSKIGDIVFGRGYLAVSEIYGISAHSDFLEIIFDFGIISMFFYLAFLYTLFLANRKNKIKNTGILALMVIYGLTNNMLFSTAISVSVFMCIGLLSNKCN